MVESTHPEDPPPPRPRHPACGDTPEISIQECLAQNIGCSSPTGRDGVRHRTSGVRAGRRTQSRRGRPHQVESSPAGFDPPSRTAAPRLLHHDRSARRARRARVASGPRPRRGPRPGLRSAQSRGPAVRRSTRRRLTRPAASCRSRRPTARTPTSPLLHRNLHQRSVLRRSLESAPPPWGQFGLTHSDQWSISDCHRPPGWPSGAGHPTCD